MRHKESIRLKIHSYELQQRRFYVTGFVNKRIATYRQFILVVLPFKCINNFQK